MISDAEFELASSRNRSCSASFSCSLLRWSSNTMRSFSACNGCCNSSSPKIVIRTLLHQEIQNLHEQNFANRERKTEKIKKWEIQTKTATFLSLCSSALTSKNSWGIPLRFFCALVNRIQSSFINRPVFFSMNPVSWIWTCLPSTSWKRQPHTHG